MDQQEANALQFLREHLEEERRARGQDAEASNSEIPVTEVVTRMNSSVKYALAENHILRHGVAVHCITKASELTVLKESLVDFDNLKAHGFDLWEDVLEQGWENFFTRLHGPVYENLVKDFWRQAECDDHYVVSHVLGKKIVITEKSIALLLNLPHKVGIRAPLSSSLKPNKSKMLHSTIFAENPEGKSISNIHTLFPRCRIWYSIIMRCIHPRPLNNSPDYINLYQGCLVYSVIKHQKICLPYVLFPYLKDCIQKSRTTADPTKPPKISYIPFGRLISDLLTENGLVDDLRKTKYVDDLKESVGDEFNAKNLKNIQLIEEVVHPPREENSEDIIKKRFTVDGYPLFTKLDSPEVVALYVFELQRAGVDTSAFRFEDLPDAPPEVSHRAATKRTSSRISSKEPAAKRSRTVKEEKKKKSVARKIHYSSTVKGNSGTPSPVISSSELRNAIANAILPTSVSPTSITPTFHVQTSKPTSSEPQSSEPPKPQHSESQTSKVDIPIFHNDITPDMFAPRSTQLPTIILPPPNSTQIQTPISSAPIQTETIPITTTTTQPENLIYLDASDSEATISNPLQTKISNPLPTQTDSGETLSNVSSIKSAEFIFSEPPPDPETPPTHTLPTSQNTPTSNPPTSENIVSEVLVTVISSAPSLAIIPYTHSLEIAQPSQTLNLLDCITNFTYAARKKASDLMESPSSNPNMAKTEWELYKAWLASECDHLKIIAENQADSCVKSVREAWLAKQKEAEEREHAIWLKYQEEVCEQEM